jgi:hypothetical protein
MKKLIPLFVLLVGATSALAQGTVLFANQPLGTSRKILMPSGAGVSGTQYSAELLYQNATGTWVSHPTTASFFATSIPTFAGYWNGANRTLTAAGGPSVADPTRGNPVQMQIRVWDATGGRTFAEAVQAGGLWGTSAIFNYIEEFDSPAGTDDKYMKSFQSFTLVPEPSVIGLGVIGLGALFLLRRRK